MIVGAEKTSAGFGIVNDPNPIVLMSKNNDRAIESDYISCRWQKPTQQSHSKSLHISSVMSQLYLRHDFPSLINLNLMLLVINHEL